VLDLRESRICVTGGAGFLGRHVVECLRQHGVPTGNIFVPRRCDFDLTCEPGVQRMFDVAQPDVVIHLAAEVGGIGANREQPGRFFYANLAMGMHLIEVGRRRRLRKFVHTGTVCAYPKFTPVPFREDELWNGYPEETNAPYGVAKKALFVMLDAYRQQYGLDSAVVVPVNLYGPHDNFDPHSSHVIPALIRKFEQARTSGESAVTCWGTGSASREFLYVTDAAEGIVRAAQRIDDPQPINLGSGEEISIADLARRVADAVGFAGEIGWDTSKPDGQPRRCLDVARARALLDWRADTPFDEGLAATVAWWREHGATHAAA